VFINDWLWRLRRRLRRKAIDRAFARQDAYDAKVAEVKEFSL